MNLLKGWLGFWVCLGVFVFLALGAIFWSEQRRIRKEVAEVAVHVQGSSKEEVVGLALVEIEKLKVELAKEGGNKRESGVQKRTSLGKLEVCLEHLAKEDAAKAKSIEVKLEELFSRWGNVNYGMDPEITILEIIRGLNKILEG
jgi:hypothetical protein